MSNPFLDVLGWVGSSLDKPGAAVRGLLAGRPDQLANLIPFSDTLGITDPSQRTRGTDLLGLDPETTGGMLGGMGAEIATDPLNLLMGAGLFRNLARGRAMQEGYRGAQAGYEATEAARQPLVEAAGRAEANNALRRALLGTGGMPEEVAMQTKAVDAAGNPVRTYHGTGAVYDKYDPLKDRGESLLGPGYYSTESGPVAGGYGGQLIRRPAEAGEFRSQGPYYTAPHVRMQYLDYRNPLDLRGGIGQPEAAELAAKLGRSGLVEDYLVQKAEALKNYPGAELPAEDFYHALVGGNPSVFSSGADKALLNQQLWEQGYDAITHMGGGGLRGGHQVHIVPRPEQIYSPWVAPLEQAMPMIPPPAALPLPPRLPRQSPLLGPLVAQNILGRAG